MIVIDTSVAVKWTFDEPGHSDALALLELVDQRIAPDLLLPELLHVVRKKRLRGEGTSEQARIALRGLDAAIGEFVPSQKLAASALALSEALNHAIYDCFFLAAALGSGVLVTADGVFARKCTQSGYGAFVFLLGDPLPVLLAKTAALDLPPAIALDELKRLAEMVDSTFTSLGEMALEANAEIVFVSSDIYLPAFKSPAYIAMRKRLAALTSEQLSAVLATAWLGREHHGPQHWPNLIANARRMTAPSFEANASYIIAQMSNLLTGLEKLRRTGLM